MLVAHKIRLKPHKVQASYFARAAGTACFAYNWALAEWGRQYQAWKRDNTQPTPSHLSLRRALNAIKREEFPWMLQVSKSAPQMAIIQLGTAVQNFFSGRARYPKFRKKGVHDRFSISNDQLSVNATHIRIPRLGGVRMWLRFAGKIMSATVSRVADKWFSSSKTCCKCGLRHKGLSWSERVFSCPSCGFKMDRDHNSGINLKNYGLKE